MSKFAKLVETPDGEQVVLMRIACECGCGCMSVHAAMRINNAMTMRVITEPLQAYDDESITKEAFIALMDAEFEKFGPAEAQAMRTEAILDTATSNNKPH